NRGFLRQAPADPAPSRIFVALRGEQESAEFPRNRLLLLWRSQSRVASASSLSAIQGNHRWIGRYSVGVIPVTLRNAAEKELVWPKPRTRPIFGARFPAWNSLPDG